MLRLEVIDAPKVIPDFSFYSKSVNVLLVTISNSISFLSVEILPNPVSMSIYKGSTTFS